MKTELQERSDILAINLQRSIDNCFEVLRSISQLYASAQRVERRDFQRFVEPILLRNPSIHALEWLPRLSDVHRLAFEAMMQAEGYPHFQITERSPTGGIRVAQRRSEYFPVTYVEPLSRNQLALGFDLAADAIRGMALSRACDLGQIVVSGRIELVQEADPQLGFLVVLPVYGGGKIPATLEARQKAVQGCLVGVFRIADIVRMALPGLDLEQVDFYLYDKSEKPGDGFLAFFAADSQQVIATPFHHQSDHVAAHSYQESLICTRTFSVADRLWSLLLLPKLTYVDRAALVEQSQQTADAATARAESLRVALQNLQQAQERWFWENRLMTGGIGLVLLIVSGVSFISYQALSLASGFEGVGSLSRIGRTLWMDEVGIALVFGLLISIYYLLQRQIAERSSAEAVLCQANDELESQIQKQTMELDSTRELNEFKLRFFSMASHEFRTPLSTILISVQSLEKFDQGERQRKYLTRIRSATKLMAQLLSDILTLTRAESGKLESRPTWLEVKLFCQQVVEEIQMINEVFDQIILETSLPEISAYLDEKLLHSILSNLLSNAIKYSPARQPIYLRLHQLEEQIVFEVEDHGIGIPQADQSQLYEAFFRGQNVHNIHGTGIGLTVVKSCLDQLGGSIRLRSQVGVGSLFTVTLPLMAKPG